MGARRVKVITPEVGGTLSPDSLAAIPRTGVAVSQRVRKPSDEGTDRARQDLYEITAETPAEDSQASWEAWMAQRAVAAAPAVGSVSLAVEQPIVSDGTV